MAVLDLPAEGDPTLLHALALIVDIFREALPPHALVLIDWKAAWARRAQGARPPEGRAPMQPPPVPTMRTGTMR